HLIVDFARRRDAAKRGAGAFVEDLDAMAERVADPDAGLDLEILGLDRALAVLEASSPELAQLVELRFFAGLTLEEIEPIAGRSVRTRQRGWRRARAFLLAELGAGADGAASSS